MSPTALADQFGPTLFGLCVHLCGRRADAEDLYQETWVRILEKLPRYKPDLPFLPWAAKICVNLYRDTRRKEKLRAFFPLEGRPHAEPDGGFTGKMEIEDAVDRLPEKYRVAVILRCYENLSEAETAKILGLSPGGVKSRLSRARKLLKEALYDEAKR